MFNEGDVHPLTLFHLAIVLALATATPSIGADPAQHADTKRVDDLIRQLADAEFAKREAASRELEEMGEPALPALRKAAAAHEDPELRQRAARVVREISIARLIRQLADARFTKRETASRELETIGTPALPALRKAAASHEDIEIRQRTARLVRTIEARR